MRLPLHKNGHNRSRVKRLSDWQTELSRRYAGSLRTHLIVWNVAALMLLMGVLGVVCRVVTLKVIMASVDDELTRSVRMYRRPPHFGPPPDGQHHGNDNRSPNDPHDPGNHDAANLQPGNHDPGRHEPRPPDADNPYHAHLFRRDGTTAIHSDTRAVWDADGLSRAQSGVTVIRTLVVGDEPLRILSTPGYGPFGELGVVQCAYPLRDVYRAVDGINLALLILAPFGLIAAIWMGVALTRRVLYRVHVLTQSAGMNRGFAHRLPVTGNDEFSELAGAFNQMLSGLEGAYQQQKKVLEQQQRFTADASHELKTPLTIIRGTAGIGAARTNIDDRSKRAFQEIECAAESMSGLVQDLLLLARSDEGRHDETNVEVALNEVLHSARRMSPSPERVIIDSNAADEEIMVSGSESDLTRLFRNLIDNALRYSEEKCSPVVVRAACEGKEVAVTIVDRGIGIPAEHLAHLGERFYRVDPSRTRPTGGTGLGLSICKSIAAAHGGTVGFDSKPGHGTTVTVRLPITGCQNPSKLQDPAV